MVVVLCEALWKGWLFFNGCGTQQEAEIEAEMRLVVRRQGPSRLEATFECL